MLIRKLRKVFSIMHHEKSLFFSNILNYTKYIEILNKNTKVWNDSLSSELKEQTSKYERCLEKLDTLKTNCIQSRSAYETNYIDDSISNNLKQVDGFYISSSTGGFSSSPPHKQKNFLKVADKIFNPFVSRRQGSGSKDNKHRHNYEHHQKQYQKQIQKFKFFHAESDTNYTKTIEDVKEYLVEQNRLYCCRFDEFWKTKHTLLLDYMKKFEEINKNLDFMRSDSQFLYWVDNVKSDDTVGSGDNVFSDQKEYKLYESVESFLTLNYIKNKEFEYPANLMNQCENFMKEKLENEDSIPEFSFDLDDVKYFNSFQYVNELVRPYNSSFSKFQFNNTTPVELTPKISVLKSNISFLGEFVWKVFKDIKINSEEDAEFNLYIRNPLYQNIFYLFLANFRKFGSFEMKINDFSTICDKVNRCLAYSLVFNEINFPLHILHISNCIRTAVKTDTGDKKVVHLIKGIKNSAIWLDKRFWVAYLLRKLNKIYGALISDIDHQSVNPSYFISGLENQIFSAFSEIILYMKQLSIKNKNIEGILEEYKDKYGVSQNNWNMIKGIINSGD